MLYNISRLLMFDCFPFLKHALNLAANSQGFVNLDFESANLAPSPPNQVKYVPIASALPGWTASAGSAPINQVMQNSFDFGTANVSILGPNYPAAGPQSQADSAVGTLDGHYTVLLQAGGGINPNGDPTTVNTSISQTGTIPFGYKSIEFKAWQSYSTFSVSFDGNTLPLVPIDLTANYNIYGVDISAYAGQTGPLDFTAIFGSGLSLVELDDITFSTQAVPEPSPLILTGFGGLIFLLRRRLVANR